MLKRAQLSVSSRLEELSTVQQWFHTQIAILAAQAPWINEQFDQLNLALAEGFTNAVRHAHTGLPSSTPVEIELLVELQQIEIRIFDQGDRFDPNSLQEPQPGSLREGGYGWFLLRRLADQVTYEYIGDYTETDKKEKEERSFSPKRQRNCLRIVKTARVV
ncbi:MAG: serine/threonine-protein kinase RsbW [Phormidesmis priestleyi Ana]|uniref:Serine/threonine-protein kinase RsbW n=1 Tax=Phormidesmis priestleyi Ana TaxID=1666911 RepID=A0A0P7ZLM9_9CYAN|nr:MAG: serine/threonine-protein kinase RsbW [Phormidesmis priestleyi Ana]